MAAWALIAAILASAAVQPAQASQLQSRGRHLLRSGEFAAWVPDWWHPSSVGARCSTCHPMHYTRMHQHNPNWGWYHQLANFTYWAQDREDAYAFEHFFYQMASGTYLELGALDGYFFSNSLFSHAYFGWKGLLIEASPLSYAKLIQNRPGDICVNAAVCDRHKTVHYIQGNITAVNGIFEFMPNQFKAQWHPNVTKDNLATYPGVIKVPCYPLRAILKKFGITHIDLFSLDVEGAELAVLQTLDFTTFTFSVAVIEENADTDAIIALLASHKYKFHGRVVRNLWFVHQNFVPSRATD